MTELEIRKAFMTKNDCYWNNCIKVKGLMLHSTGANNPNCHRYVDLGISTMHWNKSGLGKCVHAFIGKDPNGETAIYQTLPWYINGGHCGKGKKGSANTTHIGVEMCEDGLTNSDYFYSCIHAAEYLFAVLCIEFNLDPLKPGVVISHREGYLAGIASNHGDPNHWLSRMGYTMDKFRYEVKKAMDELQKQPTQDVVSAWAKDSWDWGVKNQIIADNLPQFNCTKEQVITMIKKALDAYNRKE